MKPYSSYKNSGVGWIGKIPTNWNIRKGKYLFEIKKTISGEDGYDVLSVTQQGVKIKDITSGKGQLSMDYTKYQLVDVGDFVMNHMDLLTGYVDISKYDGITSPDYRVFSLIDKKSINRYYLYLFQMGYKNKIFYGLGQGSSMFGRWRLPADEFNNFKFPYPSDLEQQQIVKYLDTKIVKIDELIEKTGKKIELLKEKRSSLIKDCVTMGLNHDVETKDTGVEWIGRIPSHWSLLPLKYYFDYSKGSNGQKLTKTYIEENKGEYPVYSGMTEGDGILGYVNEYEFDFPFQVIFTTTVGAKSMTVRLLKGRFSLSQNCLIMIKKKECLPCFICYFLAYDFTYRRELLPNIFQPSLRMEDLDQYRILIPPVREQQIIVDYLDEQTRKTDSTIEKETQRIELLKEYRQSLISEVVTGKIDVRDWKNDSQELS